MTYYIDDHPNAFDSLVRKNRKKRVYKKRYYKRKGLIQISEEEIERQFKEAMVKARNYSSQHL